MPSSLPAEAAGPGVTISTLPDNVMTQKIAIFILMFLNLSMLDWRVAAALLATVLSYWLGLF